MRHDESPEPVETRTYVLRPDRLSHDAQRARDDDTVRERTDGLGELPLDPPELQTLDGELDDDVVDGESIEDDIALDPTPVSGIARVPDGISEPPREAHGGYGAHASAQV